MNRNPRNHIGKHILAWCKRHDMSYGYACASKKGYLGKGDLQFYPKGNFSTTLSFSNTNTGFQILPKDGQWGY